MLPRLANCRTLASASKPLIKLRDYQQEAINNVLLAAKRGIRRPAVVLATGGGKTVVMSYLIPQLKKLTEKGNRTLVLAHKEELVRQAADTISKINPDLSVRIDMQKLKPDLDADVIVGSVPTLVRMSRLGRYDPLEFKTIILDECHHATAGSWTKILGHFKATEKDLDIYVVGFTATLERSDGASLGSVFEEIVFERSLITMVEKKELCDVKFSTMKVDVDLSNVPARFGDYASDKLSLEVNQENVNSQVARAYLQLKKEFGFKSTLIFCVDINHCKTLCGVLQKNGVNAQYVTGETVRHERQAILQDFKNGEIDVLCNVLVFTEGTDIPNIDSLILARPTKSRPLLVQMIGRGLRLHQGKDVCHVVDMTGTCDIGILSVPTLFDLPAGHNVQGKSLAELQEEKEAYDIAEEIRKEEARRKEVEDAYEIQQKLKDLSILFTTFEGFADLEKVTTTMYEDGSTVNHKIRDSFLDWVRLEYDVWGYQFGTLYLLLERTVDETGKTQFVLSQCAVTPLAVVVASKFKAPRSSKHELKTSPNLSDILTFSENAFAKYQRRSKGPKPITTKQMDNLERLLVAKYNQLYADLDTPSLESELQKFSLARASALIFAAKYSKNSLWVKWELQNMFGLSKKQKSKVSRQMKLLAKSALTNMEILTFELLDQTLADLDKAAPEKTSTRGP